MRWEGKGGHRWDSMGWMAWGALPSALDSRPHAHLHPDDGMEPWTAATKALAAAAGNTRGTAAAEVCNRGTPGLPNTVPSVESVGTRSVVSTSDPVTISGLWCRAWMSALLQRRTDPVVLAGGYGRRRPRPNGEKSKEPRPCRRLQAVHDASAGRGASEVASFASLSLWCAH